jgi:hypothetical protein
VQEDAHAHAHGNEDVHVYGANAGPDQPALSSSLAFVTKNQFVVGAPRIDPDALCIELATLDCEC